MADERSLYDQIFEHISAKFPDLPLHEPTGGSNAPLRATPFVWRDPTTIPPREFLYDKHYVRRFVSATVAPGGVGKTSLSMTEALSLVSGRSLLGKFVEGPSRVWMWNGEDPLEEMERRLHAICIQHGVGRGDGLETRLHMDSGRDSPIRMAEQTRDGTMLVDIVMSDLEQEIYLNRIDALIIDPFISSHGVPENDNPAIDRIVKALGQIAGRTNCAIELVHHVRKSRDGDEVQAEDARGAQALVDGCRSVRTLTRMNSDAAQGYGLSELERQSYFYVKAGKANLAPPSDRDWHKLVGVGIGNSTAFRPEDYVAVVTTWEAPQLFEGVSPADVRRVQEAVAAGNYRASSQSKEWVGEVVGDTLGINVTDKQGAKRVRDMLKKWLHSGLLVESEEMDSNRIQRKFIRSGDFIDTTTKVFK